MERPAFPVDLDQQAWYLIQAHALGFAAGAESIGVYKLIDILLPPGGESFGILRPDYSRRPAYLAYLTTIAVLRGFSGPVEMQQTDDFFIITFRKDHQLVRVLWARNDRALTLQVPAVAGSGQLLDYAGNGEVIAAQNGQYQITLDGARCAAACEIGGPPLFLVEEDLAVHAEDLRVVETPLRTTLTATPEVSLTYTPWPTSTVEPTATPTATNTATATPAPTLTATSTVTSTPFPPTATEPPGLPTPLAAFPAQAERATPAAPGTDSGAGVNSFSALAVAGVGAVGLIMLLLRTRKRGG